MESKLGEVDEDVGWDIVGGGASEWESVYRNVVNLELDRARKELRTSCT